MQALFVHDILLDPNPFWWPLLYLLDIILGIKLGRVFTARMMAYDYDDPEKIDNLSDNDRFSINLLGVITGVLWVPSLIAWGLVKIGGAVNRRTPSITDEAKKIIEKRNAKQEQPTLGSLTAEQKEIA